MQSRCSKRTNSNVKKEYSQKQKEKKVVKNVLPFIEQIPLESMCNQTRRLTSPILLLKHTRSPSRFRVYDMIDNASVWRGWEWIWNRGQTDVCKNLDFALSSINWFNKKKRENQIKVNSSDEKRPSKALRKFIEKYTEGSTKAGPLCAHLGQWF